MMCTGDDTSEKEVVSLRVCVVDFEVVEHHFAPPGPWYNFHIEPSVLVTWYPLRIVILWRYSNSNNDDYYDGVVAVLGLMVMMLMMSFGSARHAQPIPPETRLSEDLANGSRFAASAASTTATAAPARLQNSPVSVRDSHPAAEAGPSVRPMPNSKAQHLQRQYCPVYTVHTCTAHWILESSGAVLAVGAGIGRSGAGLNREGGRGSFGRSPAPGSQR